MKITRRKFLGLSFFAGILPIYKKTIFANTLDLSKKKSILILVELRGGNDGLNTLIPFDNPVYFLQRPNIAIENYLKLNSQLALNSNMKELMPFWEERKLTFALGVGWPNPSRSHFKAMDQWSVGNEEGRGIGWLAKISDSIKNNQYLLSLGPTGSDSVEGGIIDSIHLLKRKRIFYLESNYVDNEFLKNRRVLKEFLKIDESNNDFMNKLNSKVKKLPPEIKFPKGKLSQQTKVALELINSDIAPSIFQMELGGFDTHQNQINRQNQKLKELSENISCLWNNTKKLRNDIDLNIVITSEFGRRLKENDSFGTDHGSASVAILIGDSFKDKFIGYYPDLNKLDNRGDLIPNLLPNDLYDYIENKIW